MTPITKPVDRTLCFVLMPFRKDLLVVYDTIKEVVEQRHKMTCQRGDDIYSAGIIIDEVWTKICEAQIVIADATGRNTNVFYEMGLAHAVGKSVIVLAQSMNDIPFDLRNRRIILYRVNALDLLASQLSKVIKELKWNLPEIKEWITTDVQDLMIGISSPSDGSVVATTPIEASGRIVGLPTSELRFYIQGFVLTNKEYQQGSAWLDKDGYWKINEIHLGSTAHKLFFQVHDESGRLVAKSREITVIKRGR